MTILLISLLAGILTQLLGRFLYDSIGDSIPRPVLIGVLFLILSSALAAVVHLFRPAVKKFKPLGLSPSVAVIGLIAAIFLAAMLFQFLYGLGLGKDTHEPTSYVFLIDNSGSMEDSDPDQVRFDAVDSIIKDKEDDFPYMIYGFSDTPEVIRDMEPKSKGHGDIKCMPNGGTSIRLSLQTIIDDYTNGKWDGGTHPRVILLTDGYATDIGFMSGIGKILKQYNKNGISISTVGLGYVDEDLMKDIAEETGGVFIQVEDVSKLSEAMSEAAVRKTDRDLLSSRRAGRYNALYAVMRIVFLAILGALIGLLAALSYGDEYSMDLAMLSTAVTSLLGALAMELGTTVIGINSSWMWLVLWMLFALTFVMKHYQDQSFVPRDYLDYSRISGTGRSNDTNEPLFPDAKF